MIQIELLTENDLRKKNRVGSTKYIHQLLEFFKQKKDIHVKYKLIEQPNVNVISRLFALISLIIKNIPVQMYLRKKNKETVTTSCDLTFVESIYLSDILKDKENAILLAQDSLSRLQLSIAQSQKNVFKRLYYMISASAYLKLEIEIYKKFKKVIFVSSEDAAFIRSQVDYNNFDVLEIGLNLDDFADANNLNKKREIKKRYGDYIIFTGNMNYPPNNDAAIRLIHSIYPSVKQKYPDIKLLLAGLGSKKYNRPEKGIHGLGQVDSLKEYISCSKIYVSPLFSGSGMKNKVIEALAQKSIIIASSKSVEGIAGLTDNVHYLKANTDDEFSTLINKVLLDISRYYSLRENGHNYVLTKHLFYNKNKKMLDKLLEME